MGVRDAATCAGAQAVDYAYIHIHMYIYIQRDKGSGSHFGSHWPLHGGKGPFWGLFENSCIREAGLGFQKYHPRFMFDDLERGLQHMCILGLISYGSPCFLGCGKDDEHSAESACLRLLVCLRCLVFALFWTCSTNKSMSTTHALYIVYIVFVVYIVYFEYIVYGVHRMYTVYAVYTVHAVSAV